MIGEAMSAFGQIAQIARPSPESATARSPFSVLSRSAVSTSALNIGASSAFILSTRTSRTSATPSVIVTVMRSLGATVVADVMAFLRLFCLFLFTGLDHAVLINQLTNQEIHSREDCTMFTDGLLAGQKILVTGGGTGLGKAMATKFLSLGAEVHICGRRKSVCDETAEELMGIYGGKVVSHGVDIRDAAAVDAMIDAAFKDGPLTDLINNAAGNFISRTQDLTPRGFDAVANIVMHGTFYVTHAVGRRWIAGGHRGNVVSITVTWVRNGSPYVVPSTMSKSAIHAMTMSLAAEWGRYGIRLNTIAPGEIPTEGMSKRIKPGDEAGARTIAMNPMGRVGTMSELQNLATFLISGGCDWINGETIAMDGAQALAMGGNFYQLRDWSDADWKAARDAIVAQNEKDKAKRT